MAGFTQYHHSISKYAGWIDPHKYREKFELLNQVLAWSKRTVPPESLRKEFWHEVGDEFLAKVEEFEALLKLELDQQTQG